MSSFRIPSPDGKHYVELHDAGCIHFGPELSTITAGGFKLPLQRATIVGDAQWTPDGTFLVLSVFHSTESPDIELVSVCIRTEKSQSLVRVQKLVAIHSISNETVTVRVGLDKSAYSLK